MDRQGLSRQSLRTLPPRVERPAYDPGAVTPAIVHLGYGGFHRAHMARYTHNLMQSNPAAVAWGILGAGLLPSDQRIYDALSAQDHLYSLTERDASSETVSVIAAAAGLLDGSKGPGERLSAMASPAIRIVSLTITEAGYGLNAATKRLDFDNPAIAADLDRTRSDPSAPQSAIGTLVEAFRRRRDAGAPAFTAMSCDNIRHNGRVLKAAVLAFAERRESLLARWIEREARFPGTMVDRITPATRPEDTAGLAQRYDLIDRWPVFCEAFTQWVIEDDFADGRPDWSAVGAQFVADAAPYEVMKLRLLNASHLAIAGLGRLANLTFVDEAMRDPRFPCYMMALMDQETGPTLEPVPGVDLSAYKAALVERFANPSLRDTVDRINADAPLNYLLDPIRERLRRDLPVDLLALALAAWLRRVRGVDESGEAIEVRHPLADRLRERAIQGGEDPRPLLQIEALFGELGQDLRLVESTAYWLKMLYEIGASATLDRVIERFG